MNDRGHLLVKTISRLVFDCTVMCKNILFYPIQMVNRTIKDSHQLGASVKQFCLSKRCFISRLSISHFNLPAYGVITQGGHDIQARIRTY
jgi:hypothetical protein